MFYETFNDYMTQIKEMRDFTDGIFTECRKFNKYSHVGEEAELWFPTLEGVAVKLLEHIFEDDDGWISYYIYELDMGRSYKDGDMTDADGSIIKLRNTRELYELLIRNKSE